MEPSGAQEAEERAVLEKIEEAITSTFEAGKEAISGAPQQTEAASTLQQIEQTLVDTYESAKEVLVSTFGGTDQGSDLLLGKLYILNCRSLDYRTSFTSSIAKECQLTSFISISTLKPDFLHFTAESCAWQLIKD